MVDAEASALAEMVFMLPVNSLEEFNDAYADLAIICMNSNSSVLQNLKNQLQSGIDSGEVDQEDGNAFISYLDELMKGNKNVEPPVLSNFKDRLEKEEETIDVEEATEREETTQIEEKTEESIHTTEQTIEETTQIEERTSESIHATERTVVETVPAHLAGIYQKIMQLVMLIDDMKFSRLCDVWDDFQSSPNITIHMVNRTRHHSTLHIHTSIEVETKVTTLVTRIYRSNSRVAFNTWASKVNTYYRKMSTARVVLRRILITHKRLNLRTSWSIWKSRLLSQHMHELKKKKVISTIKDQLLKVSMGILNQKRLAFKQWFITQDIESSEILQEMAEKSSYMTLFPVKRQRRVFSNGLKRGKHPSFNQAITRLIQLQKKKQNIPKTALNLWLMKFRRLQEQTRYDLVSSMQSKLLAGVLKFRLRVPFDLIRQRFATVRITMDDPESKTGFKMQNLHMQPVKPDDQPDEKETLIIKKVLDMLQVNSRRYSSIALESSLKWRYAAADKVNARAAELNRKQVFSLNRIDRILRLNLRIPKKAALEKWHSGYRWLIIRAIQKWCLRFNTQISVILRLWYTKTVLVAENERQRKMVRRILGSIFIYEKNLLLRRCRAFNMFKRQKLIGDASSRMVLILSRWVHPRLLDGYRSIRWMVFSTRLKRAGKALQTFISNIKHLQKTKKRYYFDRWSTRKQRAVMKQIFRRIRLKQQKFLFLWHKRAFDPNNRKRDRLMHLTALKFVSRLRRKPMTLERAFQIWTQNWKAMAKRIIFRLLYAVSMSENEQIGWWRWISHLKPKSKTIWIEVPKATGCKILASIISSRGNQLMAEAWNRTLYYDPDVKSRMLKRIAYIALRTTQRAFDMWKLRALGTDRTRILRSACIDMTNNLFESVHESFSQWKIWALRDRTDDKISELSKQPDIIEGMMKIQGLQQKFQKSALKSVSRNSSHHQKRLDAIHKLLYILKSIKRREFDLWASQAGLHTQKHRLIETASTVMDMPIITHLKNLIERKGLKLGMDRLKKDRSRQILRSSVNVLQHKLQDILRQYFFMWKINSLSTKLNGEIQVLTKRPQIMEGVSKLENFQRRKPRHALRSVNKRNVTRDKMASSIRQLQLIIKNNLQRVMDNWRLIKPPDMTKERLRNAFTVVSSKFLAAEGGSFYRWKEAIRQTRIGQLKSNKKNLKLLSRAKACGDKLQQFDEYRLRASFNKLSFNMYHCSKIADKIGFLQLSFSKHLKSMFYIWKSVSNLQSQKSSLTNAADLLLAISSHKPIQDKILRKSLLIAFTRIWQIKRNGTMVTRGFQCLISSLEAAKNHYFHMWKFANMDESLRRKGRDLKVQDGLGKLEAFHAKRPRAALQSANKHRERCNKVDDSLRKLLYIYKNGLSINFERWKENASKHELTSRIIKSASLTLDSAKVLEMQSKLTRRPMSSAFNKIKNSGKEWPVLSKAMRCFAIALDDNVMRSFMRWKFTVLDKNIVYKDTKYRIAQGTNILIKLKHTWIRFALHTLNKGREHKIRTNDSIAKLLFIFKIGAQSSFDRWVLNAGLNLQKSTLIENATNAISSHHLQNVQLSMIKNRFRVAFSRILNCDRDKVVMDKALRNSMIYIRNVCKGMFYRWKISILNEDVLNQKDLRQIQNGLMIFLKLKQKTERFVFLAMSKNVSNYKKQNTAIKRLALFYRLELQICFDAWKNKTSIQETKLQVMDRVNLIFPIQHLLDLQIKLQRKRIRIQFSTIKNLDVPKGILSKALARFCSLIREDTARLFYLWKVYALNTEVAKQKRNQRISEGLQKISLTQARKPRQALRSIIRNREHLDKRDSAVKKLGQLLNSGLQAMWNTWRDQAKLRSQQEDLSWAAELILKIPESLKPVENQLKRSRLRFAFDRLKRPDPIPEKLKHAVRALSYCLESETAFSFFQWKINSQQLSHEIQNEKVLRETKVGFLVLKLKSITEKKFRQSLRYPFNWIVAKDPKPAALRIAMTILGRANIDATRRAFSIWNLGTACHRLIDLADGCMKVPIWKPLNDKLRRKPLREAFNRMKSQMLVPFKLRDAFALLSRYMTSETHRGFLLWKMWAIREKMEKRVQTLSKQPDIVHAVNKLENFRKRKPRQALRSVNRNAIRHKNIADALKSLMFITKASLKHYWAKWVASLHLDDQRLKIVRHSRKIMQIQTIQKTQEKILRKFVKSAFERISTGHKKFYKKVFNKMTTSTTTKIRKSFHTLKKHTEICRITETRKLFGWRTVNLAGVFKTRLEHQKVVLGAAQNMGQVLIQIVLIAKRLAFSAMKPPPDSILINLWKILIAKSDNALRTAWYRWSTDMHIERALDWEQNYMHAAILHPILTNQAKFYERANRNDLYWAFTKWSDDPKKRFTKSFRRMHKWMKICLTDYFRFWRYRARIDKNRQVARLMHRSILRLADTAALNVNLAFRKWAPKSASNRVETSLQLFSRKIESRMANALYNFKVQTVTKHNERLRNILSGSDNLQIIYQRSERLKTQTTFQTWARKNRSKTLRQVTRQIVSKAVDRQQRTIETFRESIVRKNIVRKTAAACRMVELKDMQNRQLLKAYFTKYRQVIFDRKRKLLRKYAVLWMMRTAIGYQPALWRWKFVIFKYDWSSLFPNHLTMMKRLDHLAHQSEWRRKQYAFFKIVVTTQQSPANFKHTRQSLQHVLGAFVRSSQESPASLQIDTADQSEHQMSPKAMQKSIIQQGLTSMNLMGFLVKDLSRRCCAVAFKQILSYAESEMANDHIADLQDDNEKLRFHNEALVQNLDRSTMNFEIVVSQLDELRVSILARALTSIR